MSNFMEGWNGADQTINTMQHWARQRAQDDRQRTLDARVTKQYNDTSGAIDDMAKLQGGIYDGGQADFSGQYANVDQGPQQGAGPVTGLKLPSYDGADGPASNAPTVATGLSPRKATPYEMNQAQQRVALAQRDMTSWGALNDKGRTLGEDEKMAKALKDNPRNEEAIGRYNLSHPTTTLGPADKNGIRQVSVVNQDGKAIMSSVDPGQMDRLQMAEAIRLDNPMRYQQLMAEAHKDIHDHLFKQDAQTLAVGKAGNEGAAASGHVDAAKVSADAALQRANAMETRAERAGREPREVPQELVERINDLQDQRANETDPKKQAALDQQIGAAQMQAGNSIGKVMPYRVAGKAGPELDPEAKKTYYAYVKDNPNAKPNDLALFAKKLGIRPDQVGMGDAGLPAVKGWGGAGTVDTAQQQRDGQAGEIRMHEFGGDLVKAKASLAQIRAQQGRSTGETQSITKTDGDLLERGINDAQARALKTSGAGMRMPGQTATQAPAAALAAPDIPGPPPTHLTRGLSSVANPNYAQWAQQYGAAYERQQKERATSASGAASAAKARYNPYLQGGVR